MGRLTPTALCAAALALAWAPAAHAQQRFAEPGGDGPHPCVQSNPCSIETAIEAGGGVNDGDTVWLAPGTYELTDTLSITNAIEVIGAGGPGVTIRSSAAISSVVSVGNALAHIHDVRVLADGPSYALILRGRGERLVVQAEGANDTACAVSLSDTFSPRPYLRDSICHATGSNAKAVSLAVGCGAPATRTTVNAIRNVTAVGEGAGSEGVAVRTNGGCREQLDLRNVIAVGEEADLYAETDTGNGSVARITAATSAFQSTMETGDGAATPAPGSGQNLNEPAIFVDPAADDFHQAPGSPTIDAGSFDGLTGLTDFEGSQRWQGAARDIGADEFEAPPDTAIDLAPPALTSETTAEFQYKGIPVHEAAAFECSIDSSPFADCPAAGVTYTGLADGLHAFAVRGRDLTSLFDLTPATHAWRVDTKGPRVKVQRKLKLKRNGKLAAKLRCRDAAPPCGVHLKLTTRGKVRFRGKNRRLTLAGARFELPAGAKRTIRVPVPKAKARLLGKSRAARHAKAIVVARDALANKRRTASKAQVAVR